MEILDISNRSSVARVEVQVTARDNGLQFASLDSFLDLSLNLSRPPATSVISLSHANLVLQSRPFTVISQTTSKMPGVRESTCLRPAVRESIRPSSVINMRRPSQHTFTVRPCSGLTVMVSWLMDPFEMQLRANCIQRRPS